MNNEIERHKRVVLRLTAEYQSNSLPFQIAKLQFIVVVVVFS